ncbi:TIGR03084 family metal-binding protein [Sneathiella marina]|uniref:TIGR03084 family metal-binding protein n=1 Tax=Sneathiella marina TaxID=2950108 RepID=A0ABY4W5K7_9PROT|nr:TIGR03084 family metal-binding protein [Sneathiella marina]USG62481.1 TIGR03084 family metal-binding protein [Sneathiella marina]
MQQARDYLEECDALYELVTPLSGDVFDRPTEFKGWTINNILRHLHIWNWAAGMSLQDAPEFDDFLQKAMPYIFKNQLREFESLWLDELDGSELVVKWKDYYSDMAARFDSTAPSTRVRWAGPSMSARSSITARFMETWAHGQAIYDLLGVKRQNHDRINNIVVLGVNTYGWTFKNRGMEIPGPMPHIKLTAPSGAIWTYGEDSASEVVEGLAEEFCQVVTQSRNIRDTDLNVTGKIASAWMETAQCFAGPPEMPPNAGTRGNFSLT